MREKQLPPYAPVLMESIRHIGYSIEAAVADLIDNSISAYSTHIEIECIPCDNPYLFILDNGDGLSEDELIDAMKYGSSSPLIQREDYDMGRFGLGLKTASLSQCRCLTVASKKEGKLSICRWDLDHIIDRASWALQIFDPKDLGDLPGLENLMKQGKGTLVVWQKLDNMTIGATSIERHITKRLLDVSDHLSLVYHRYLSGEKGLCKLTIEINNNPLQPTDPFLVTRSEKAIPTETIMVGDNRIEITAYILPHISRLTEMELKSLGGEEGLRKRQGFYIYRNKRLIIWGTWFRLSRQDELYKLARVQVDIPNTLDHLWSLDIKKSVARPPEEVAKNFQRIIDRITSRSKRTYTYRGKKEIGESLGFVWEKKTTRTGVNYVISRENSIVKEVMEKVGKEKQKYVEHLLRLIETSIPITSIYIDSKEDIKFASTENENEAAVINLQSLFKQNVT